MGRAFPGQWPSLQSRAGRPRAPREAGRESSGRFAWVTAAGAAPAQPTCQPVPTHPDSALSQAPKMCDSPSEAGRSCEEPGVAPGPATPVWGLTHEGVASWSSQMPHLLWKHPCSCRPVAGPWTQEERPIFGGTIRKPGLDDPSPSGPGQERRWETPDLAAGRIGLCCQAGLSAEGGPPALSQARAGDRSSTVVTARGGRVAMHCCPPRRPNGSPGAGSSAPASAHHVSASALPEGHSPG